MTCIAERLYGVDWVRNTPIEIPQQLLGISSAIAQLPMLSLAGI